MVLWTVVVMLGNLHTRVMIHVRFTLLRGQCQVAGTQGPLSSLPLCLAAVPQVFPPVNPRILEQLRAVDAIVYGAGILYTSICPSLVSHRDYLLACFIPLRGVRINILPWDCFAAASGHWQRTPLRRPL